MKKVIVVAFLFTALIAHAESIIWGFGNYGFYSGYQLYGSIINPDPVLQGYIEVNINLPFAVGPLDDLGYIGGGYFCNSDLTGRRNASYRRAFNENDPNIHWGKTFWFDDKRTWGLDYRTSVVWYCYPRTGGRNPINRITMEWLNSCSLLNPYLVPYLTFAHEYRETNASLLQLGLRKQFQITDNFSITPLAELVWRDKRYGWCFSNNGLDENWNMLPAGFATIKLELDATYMLTKYIGIFAKVAYCQNIDPNLRDAARLARHDPEDDGYGCYNEFAWGCVGVCVCF